MWFTVSWNFVEAFVAIIAGVIAGSTALIGFGFDSGIETIAAITVLWRLRSAGIEASIEQHELAESRALYIISVTFFLLAAYVVYESVNSLIGNESPETSTVGLVLSIISLVVMPALAYAKQKTGKELKSKALQSEAVETWVCAYLSLALLVGLGLYKAFGWWWADPIGALLMLPVIIWQGLEALSEARE